ncbi:hypothetical protein RKE29_22685 [Streptomyces sp. B1866]|uniref:hypothetical protein n=1 Tax=Streptomyces sp. B1866 TaxID=3075431 RepID=UPI00288DB642|nr:hypothetical protein [Streptomyces sp. B1866]MDT3399418.1 hypothetical protein [Streptomyces sp. B1866]
MTRCRPRTDGIAGGRLLSPEQYAELLRSDAAAGGYTAWASTASAPPAVPRPRAATERSTATSPWPRPRPDRSRRVVWSVTTTTFPLDAGQPAAASLQRLPDAALCA